ncbi:MAG: tRNA (cytosine(32)/uridine(32)-2'-O)-methyltransferase TrmJ, partial [Pseudomonadales bacterium]|nr:tRNA (cytosine(32)/uridine(32)-2'-O)-methyltransferase TrmJ [Pseudomonadales bacterium]
MLARVRIVLVGTVHSGNIGAAARAMKNMGLRRLYLAAPLDFPHREATYRAVQAT